MQTLLTSAYCPVEARPEFQDRLLDNLKERQRTTIRFRRESRRRSIFASFASSLAAAAAVLFVVWAGPFGGLDNRNPAPASGMEVAENIGAGMAGAREEVIPAVQESGPSVSVHQPDMAAAIVPAAATEGDWKVASAFAGDALPAKARATGLEYNAGQGWQAVDESSYIGITPGLSFRSSRPTTAGLGFSDGSTILIPPDSEVEATSRGFALRRGAMGVSVPQDAKNELRLDLATHDVSVVPGTLLAVYASSSPDEFADGGAPAPEVMVADGGLALARGRAGIGPMLAGNVYQLDNYVTPDLPSRPICNAERQQMEKACSVPSNAPVRAPAQAFDRNNMNQFVSMPSASGIAPSPAGFVRDGDRWVPKGYAGQETTKIKYLSDAYFSLVNSRRDLAPALSLGGAVVVNAGDGVYYEITKK